MTSVLVAAINLVITAVKNVWDFAVGAPPLGRAGAHCRAVAGSLGPPGAKTTLEVTGPLQRIDTVNGRD